MIRAARFGPRLEPGGGTTFRLWAPAANSVELVTGSTTPLASKPGSWFETFIAEAGPGFRYKFRIDGEIEVPDPASHFQPQDVNGPSEIVAHDYAWQCAGWDGRPWNEAVFVELHVGTATAAGTFRALIDQLDHFVETGVTAIELMPLADFSGRRNWGYDGVLLYAPDSAYGRPEDLKALVDAAHARGLMVFLDVVYNHFGPEGNYLGRYAPQFFTAHHHTPWGDAIDYRVEEVRAFAVENASHWLTHYRFDGLRLDAVHAITKPGKPPILEAISRAVGALAAESGRHIHLVLENDDNVAALLDPPAERPAGKYRAQWNDDYHHAWHVVLTGETRGYYIDYAKDPVRQIARALTTGFVYQGEPSEHRAGVARGEPSAHLSPVAFVHFLQNHDQVGNRAFGDRLTTLASADAVDAALAVTLLAPSPPLLFMGEEWGATHPFPFFCDFSGELADAVRRGRAAEFSGQFADLPTEKPLPDPLTEETFRSAVLVWEDRRREPHAARLKLVRDLLAVRRERVMPILPGLSGCCGKAQIDGRVISATWSFGNNGVLALLANLGPQSAPRPQLEWRMPIWRGEPPEQLPPWSVYWSQERA